MGPEGFVYNVQSIRCFVFCFVFPLTIPLRVTCSLSFPHPSSLPYFKTQTLTFICGCNLKGIIEVMPLALNKLSVTNPLPISLVFSLLLLLLHASQMFSFHATEKLFLKWLCRTDVPQARAFPSSVDTIVLTQTVDCFAVLLLNNWKIKVCNVITNHLGA